MHLPEEKTILLRENTRDTWIRPLTSDGQIYWKIEVLITCIFKPLEISLNFPPPSQRQYGDFQVDFFLLLFLHPQHPWLQVIIYARVHRTFRRLLRWFRRHKRLPHMYKNGYGAFLDFFLASYLEGFLKPELSSVQSSCYTERKKSLKICVS